MCMHQKHTASRDLGWSRAESTSHRNCMWLTVRRDQGPCKPPIQAKGWADTEKTLRIIVCGKGSCIILCNTMQTSNMLHATSVNLAASPSSNFVSWGFQEGNSTYALWSVMYLCSPRSKNCVLDFYDAQVSTAFERCWVNRVFATRTSNQVCLMQIHAILPTYIFVYIWTHTRRLRVSRRVSLDVTAWPAQVQELVHLLVCTTHEYHCIILIALHHKLASWSARVESLRASGIGPRHPSLRRRDHGRCGWAHRRRRRGNHRARNHWVGRHGVVYGRWRHWRDDWLRRPHHVVLHWLRRHLRHQLPPDLPVFVIINHLGHRTFVEENETGIGILQKGCVKRLDP